LGTFCFTPYKTILFYLQATSKKYFKHAVDLNYFKRVLRECYRLNKHLLTDNIQKRYSIMFFYQTKERLTYQEINEKTIQLFDKFIALENHPQEQ
jgi:ribonuclease P protein component